MTPAPGNSAVEKPSFYQVSVVNQVMFLLLKKNKSTYRYVYIGNMTSWKVKVKRIGKISCEAKEAC